MDVVALGVEGFTPEVPLELVEPMLPDVLPGEEPMLEEPVVPEPEAPMELVLLLEVSVLAVPVLPPVAPVLGEVEPVVLGVELDELVEVLGVVAAVLSRLVQAPSETAATSANAAAVVRDAFMEDSLGSLTWLVNVKDGLTPSFQSL